MTPIPPLRLLCAVDPAAPRFDMDLTGKTEGEVRSRVHLVTGRRWPELEARGWLLVPCALGLVREGEAAIELPPARRRRAPGGHAEAGPVLVGAPPAMKLFRAGDVTLSV